MMTPEDEHELTQLFHQTQRAKQVHKLGYPVQFRGRHSGKPTYWTDYGPPFTWAECFDYRPKPPGEMPTGTEAEVCADIARRQQLGIAKYGTTVAENPLSLRDWLVHAYHEALDQAVYLKRAIQEIDAENDPYSTPE